MINLTILRRLHGAATEGPWRLGMDYWILEKNDLKICRVVNGRHAVSWATELNTGKLIELAPDLAAAVLDHPAALRAAMIRGYEIALEEAARNGIGLPRADKCAALLDILKEYPDAH